MRIPWNRIKRRRFLLALAGLVPLAGLADALWLEPNWVAVRKLVLHSGTPSLRLVHFTDLHHKGNRKLLESVVQKINALGPDLVCFTGDLIEDAPFLPETLEILRGIKAPLYGVPGNHDYWSRADFAPIVQCFAATGGAWLENTAIDALAGKVRLTGWARGTSNQHPPRPGAKNILLMHYPAWVEALGSASYDLILAGHSHGGQVRLPFFGPLIVPFDTGKYSLGLFQTPAGPFHVSAGVGCFYFNIRFNCRPEIVLVEL